MIVNEDVLIDEVIPKLNNASSKLNSVLTQLESLNSYLPDNFEYKDEIQECCDTKIDDLFVDC